MHLDEEAFTSVEVDLSESADNRLPLSTVGVEVTSCDSVDEANVSGVVGMTMGDRVVSGFACDVDAPFERVDLKVEVVDRLIALSCVGGGENGGNGAIASVTISNSAAVDTPTPATAAPIDVDSRACGSVAMVRSLKVFSLSGELLNFFIKGSLVCIGLE